MASSYLELELLAACPSFREHWEALRRARHPHEEPSETDFLSALQLHLLGLVIGGRIAEFSRFARSMERLLGEADPVLAELLQEELVRPLASSVSQSRLAPGAVTQYLGPRILSVWRQASG
jgi:hypothetical protein